MVTVWSANEGQNNETKRRQSNTAKKIAAGLQKKIYYTEQCFRLLNEFPSDSEIGRCAKIKQALYMGVITSPLIISVLGHAIRRISDIADRRTSTCPYTSEYNLAIVNITLNSYLVLFVTKHRHVLQMFFPRRAMGRFLDIV